MSTVTDCLTKAYNYGWRIGFQAGVFIGIAAATLAALTGIALTRFINGVPQ